MSNSVIGALKERRTQYVLGKTLPLSIEDTTTLIQEAVKLSPSAFNSQSSRAIILFGSQSDKLWNITKVALRKIVPAEDFAQTEGRVNGYAAGAGTVLFYEDQEPVRALQEQFPIYADNFPVWSEHASGMAQLAVWTALANSGIGASLQHYNPLIDAEVEKTWNIPTSWKLRAQMPFGSNEQPFAEKAFIDDKVRFRAYS